MFVANVLGVYNRCPDHKVEQYSLTRGIINISNPTPGANKNPSYHTNDAAYCPRGRDHALDDTTIIPLRYSVDEDPNTSLVRVTIFMGNAKGDCNGGYSDNTYAYMDQSRN